MPFNNKVHDAYLLESSTEINENLPAPKSNKEDPPASATGEDKKPRKKVHDIYLMADPIESNPSVTKTFHLKKPEDFKAMMEAKTIEAGTDGEVECVEDLWHNSNCEIRSTNVIVDEKKKILHFVGGKDYQAYSISRSEITNLSIVDKQPSSQNQECHSECLSALKIENLCHNEYPMRTDKLGKALLNGCCCPNLLEGYTGNDCGLKGEKEKEEYGRKLGCIKQTAEYTWDITFGLATSILLPLILG